MIRRVPAYANKFFYSLGFMSMTALAIIVASGIIMVAFGPYWWLTTGAGLLMRSIHLWAAEAFIIFVILHCVIVFLTSGYRPPRRLTWVLGSVIFFLALLEAEFGYGLRGDFSSQWRALQASDFYNGSGLGIFVNNLNYAQIYGIHIIVIPFIMAGLLFLHYMLVKFHGIAKPFRPEVAYRMVEADHVTLFARGFALAALVVALAIVFPSPLILPTTVEDVADQAPSLAAGTIVSEMARTSGTAAYMDNIDPYSYDTRSVYVAVPYRQYLGLKGGSDRLAELNAEDAATRAENIKAAQSYFSSGGVLSSGPSQPNPAIAIASDLAAMAQDGLYSEALQGEEGPDGLNGTYVDRFLSDTGIMDVRAKELGMRTSQYGMLHEESGNLPGAWWLAPIGLLDHTVLANDPNQDRDGAEILGLLALIFMAFPYIPFLNRLPEKLRLDKVIWKTE